MCAKVANASAHDVANAHKYYGTCVHDAHK